ncbi:MAG TPA: hypothetical protein VEJ63_02310 [Planctomycetota bacterium]|nr:hypothetical protein [Planctomycetota bacterium]
MRLASILFLSLGLQLAAEEIEPPPKEVELPEPGPAPAVEPAPVDPAPQDPIPDEAPPEVAAQTSVKITYAGPKVGDKTIRTVKNQMALELEITGGKRSFTHANQLEETTSIAVTVLDAGKRAATKVKAEYLKDDHASNGPDGPEKVSQIVEGRSYIVANTRTGMEVYMPTGRQFAPPEEAELVLLDFVELGRVPKMSALLADRTFIVGKTFHVPNKDAQGLFADAGTLKDLNLTLRSVRKEAGVDVAVFDVAVDFERRDGYLTYKAALKGEAAVVVNTALPLRISVAGDMKVTGSKPAEGLLPEKTAEGKGTMKYSITNDPSAK